MKKKLEKDAKHIHNPQTLIRGTERRITMEVTSASPFALDGGSDEPLPPPGNSAQKSVLFLNTGKQKTARHRWIGRLQFAEASARFTCGGSDVH